MKRTESLWSDFNTIFARWGESLRLPESDLARDSAILRFELTFEVAWKLVQHLVREHGYEANSPRQAFQRAFSMGWISDEEIWVEILRARNTAVHVYREEYAAALYARLGPFYEAFDELRRAIAPEFSA